MANVSDQVLFVLVGFPSLQERFYALVGTIFFLAYVMSLCANSTVVLLIILREHLHQPMYLIILNLAISDIIYDTATLPKIISKYWSGDGIISFVGCFIQMPIVHTLNCLDSFTIMLMALDRYVAICMSLRYHSIMTNQVAVILCSIGWLVCGFVGLYVASWALPLPYCGPNKVRNIYCSLSKVAFTACVDSTIVRTNSFYAGVVMHMTPLSFIVLSYIVIIATVCLTMSSGNWLKMFNTCVTHWFIITVFFIPRIVEYGYNQYQLVPNADVNVLIICLYSYVPHVFNPIIFCLRNNEIKKTLGQIFKQMTI
ncbi:olfactory receptor 6B1-like [Aquarana catesbeiana]|uniref:olfactory receptor 6B1-like n=1 Tax=Aquarana catesbeiana TaxID=8400 RepID=UPI003CC9B34D